LANWGETSESEMHLIEIYLIVKFHP